MKMSTIIHSCSRFIRILVVLCFFVISHVVFAQDVAWQAEAQNSGSWSDGLQDSCSFRVLVDGASISNSGNRVRLTLKGRSSGAYTVQRVSLVTRDGTGVNGEEGSFVPVTFGSTWETGVSVPAGGTVTSDPVAMDIEEGQAIFVTYYVGTAHYPNLLSGGSQLTTWISAGGNYADRASTRRWSSLTMAETNNNIYAAQQLDVEELLSTFEVDDVRTIQDGSYTYSATVGNIIPVGTSNYVIKVTYKAHSQSGSNWAKNRVRVRILRGAEVLADQTDSYNSETASGTMYGYWHTQLFYGLDVLPGDDLDIEMTVTDGDYCNYVSATKVVCIWDALNDYTITATKTGNGVISPSGVVPVADFGGSQLFVMDPDTNYYVSDVIADGVSIGGVTNYTFTNLISNRTIHATFTDMDLSNRLMQVELDTNVFVSATTASYAFSVGDWILAGTDLICLKVDYTCHSQSVQNTQPNRVRLTLKRGAEVLGYSDDSYNSQTQNGPVLGFVHSQMFKHLDIEPGDNLTLDVQVITGDYVNYVSTVDVLTYWDGTQETITASAGTGGSISPAGYVQVQTAGSRTFAVVPDVHWQIADVLVNGSSMGVVSNYTFTNVTNAQSIEALFVAEEEDQVATLDDEYTGNIRNATITNSFTVGSPLGVSISNVALEVFYKAHSQSSSNFDKNRVSLTLVKDSVPIGTYTDLYDSESTTGTPVPGFMHSHVFYDLGLDVGDTVDLVILVADGDGQNAVSEIDVVTYWDQLATNMIVSTAGAGGAITPNGTNRVLYLGGTESFYIVVDANYAISDVMIDGESVGVSAHQMITNILEDHTIHAAFAATPATAVYPQNLVYPYGIVPANALDTDATTAYICWKDTFVVSSGAGGYRRVLFDDGSSTVSEGMGYGLLVAVNYNDKQLFDDLWGYCDIHLNANGLMSWLIDSSGTATYTEAATDGDQKIAFALLMADQQWGSAGATDYRSEATNMLAAILQHEVHADTKVLKAGDGWLDADVVNPSYYMPAFYRAFRAVTGDSTWSDVITNGYHLLSQVADPATGFVPDWCAADGSALSCATYPDNCVYDFGYNAVRTPFYTAMDYIMYGTPAARSFCEKMVSFADGTIGLTNIIDGYALDGTPNGVIHNSVYVSMLSAATLAADAGNQARCNSFYSENVSINSDGYFNQCLRLLALLLENGNFIYLENTAPIVDAGGNQTIPIATPTLLDGTVGDDAMPQDVLTYAWSKVSGPGAVVFGSSDAEDTMVTFADVGEYVIRLVASDGVLATTNEVTVTAIEQIYIPPAVEITTPNNGVSATVYTNQVVLSGRIWAELVPVSLSWSNAASGASGSGQLTFTPGMTSGVWRTLPIMLSSGAQTVSVWVEDESNNVSDVQSVLITYDNSGLPGSLENYPTGAVWVTDCRVNGERNNVWIRMDQVGPDTPTFSWLFGDALNQPSPANMVRTSMGARNGYDQKEVCADVTGDGLLDVVVANNGQNFVLVNNGGSPSTWTDVDLGTPLSDSSADLCVEDMNGDGLVDIVCGNYNNYNYVLVNNGSSPDTWERIQIGTLSDGTRGIAASDLNGDGLADVVIGNHGQNMVYFNNGDRADTWQAIYLGNTTGDQTRAVAVLDVTDDGLPDVVLANIGSYSRGDQNCAIVNNGGSPDTWSRINLGSAYIDMTYALDVADLNGDQRMDMIFGNSSASNWQNFVLINTGSNPTEWPRYRLGSECYDASWGIRAADVTADGRPDILVGNYNQQDYVLINNGGTPDTWIRSTLGSGVSDDTRSIHVIDMNNDDNPDVVVGNGGQDYLYSWPASSVSYGQVGYQLQVARSESDLISGNVFWDSGIVMSSDMGDGQYAIEQAVACNEVGAYYWHVKVFSSSGYQSEWSDPDVYSLPQDQVFVAFSDPVVPLKYVPSTPYAIAGWTSFNATNLIWSNAANGAVGSLAVPGAFTQHVALVSGTNVVSLTATAPGAARETESVTLVYCPDSPTLVISAPNSGDDYTTLDINTSLSGYIGLPIELMSNNPVYWSNHANGVWGELTRTNGQTQWPAVAGQEIDLMAGANSIRVWGTTIFETEISDQMTITCNNSNAPTLTIEEPCGGDDVTVYYDGVALRGYASDVLGLTTVVWSNEVSGAMGFGLLESGVGSTGSMWHSSRITLTSGVQQLSVRAINVINRFSPAATISLTYDVNGMPADLNDYPTGAVAATVLQSDGQWPPLFTDDRTPEFSWAFGDLINAGSPTNSVRYELGSPLSDRSRCSAAGDLTGDGLPDVVIGNAGFDDVPNYALINNGTTNFAEWSRMDISGVNGAYELTYDLAIADVTGDDLSDIVVINHYSYHRNCVLVNNGTTNIAQWERVDFINEYNVYPRCVAVGDVTSDGRPDLVIGSDNGDAQNYVLVNNGNSPDTWSSVTLGGMLKEYTKDLAIGDVTGDDLPDVIIANAQALDQQNYVLVNNGSDDPSSWTRVALGSPMQDYSFAIDIGDVNMDSRLDVVIGNMNDGDRQNYVLLNNGGSPDTWERYNLGSPHSDQTYDIQISDMNGDGSPDVLVGNYGSQNYVMLNNGGTPDTWARIALGSELSDSTARLLPYDLTGDSRPEVIVANESDQNYIIMNNDIVMPQQQQGYQVQVARSSSDLASGIYFWDSGIVESSCVGDGLTGIEQQMACDEPGDYYWHVRLFSDSGYQSPWSSPQRYELSTNQVYLAIAAPYAPPQAYITETPINIMGWASWNATNLTWSNEATQAYGTIPYSGGWTQQVAFADGTNHVSFTATAPGGLSVMQHVDVVYYVDTPRISIDQPGNGSPVTVYTDKVVLYGHLLDRWGFAEGRIVWTNVTSGNGGCAEYDWSAGQTSKTWRTPPLDLAVGPQTFQVWAVDYFNNTSSVQSLTVSYDNAGLPVDPSAYATGAVFVSSMQVGRDESLQSMDNTPLFMWTFGDALNEADPSSMTTLSLGSSLSDSTYGMAWGDVTGDSLPDVVVGNYGQNYVLVNNGSSDPASWARVNLGSVLSDNTRDVAVGDITGDDLLDVVVGNMGQSYVLVNNGSGDPSSWLRQHLGSSMSNETMSVAICDVTSDNLPDVVVGNGNDGSVDFYQNYVIVNDGTTDTAAWPRYNLGPLSPDQTLGLAVGDLTGDGLPDVFLANGGWHWDGYIPGVPCHPVRSYGSTNYVLINNGSADPSTWTRHIVGSHHGEYSTCASIIDVTGDGLADVVIGQGGRQETASTIDGRQNKVAINNGGDPATWPVINLGDTRYDDTWSIVSADITGDGLIDVVVGNNGQTDNVLINNGNGPSAWSGVGVGGAGASARALIVADVTGDGRQDLMKGALGQNQVVANNNLSMPYAQIAVQVQVAKSAEKLTAGQVVWDSGLRTITQSSNGLCAIEMDSVLQLSGTYYWQVRVISESGYQSDWLLAQGQTSESLPDGDNDGDAIPNWWEQQYFGDVISAVTNLDNDSDGVSNWKEYMALSDPTDGGDYFAPGGVVFYPEQDTIQVPGENILLNGDFASPAYTVTGTTTNWWGNDSAAHWEWAAPMNDGWRSGNAQRTDWDDSGSDGYCGIISGLWMGTNYGTMGQRRDIVPDTEYVASGYFIIESDWTGINSFKIEFLDGTATLIGGVTNDLSSVGIAWTYVEVSGTSPAGAMYAQVVIESSSMGDNGTLFFDDLDLIPIEEMAVDEFDVEFLAKTGRVYCVEYNDNLGESGSLWQSLKTNVISATQQNITITDTNLVGIDNRVYRIGVALP